MLERTVLNYIERFHLLPEHALVAAGVSGGPDSLVLLHLLKSFQQIYDLELVCIHVDHMFRGETSFEDYLFVENMCRSLDIPFEGRRIDVPAYMKETGESTQLAARKLRYGFYQEVMEKHHADVLALGHHGDDQIETMLMRISRGAAGEARAGIQVKRPFATGMLVRPLLGVSKAEIEEYAVSHGLNPRMDESNEKDDYLRNRFRHRVLPFLKEENPKVHEHFQRFSEELTEDEELLEKLAEDGLEKVWIEKRPGYAAVNIEQVLMMPKPLQRRSIHLILNYLYIKRPSSLSAIHTAQLLSLFSNPHPSAELYLPDGLMAEKSYNQCIFRYYSNESPEYSLTIKIPGETILPNGYTIKAQYIKEGISPQKGNDTMLVPVSAVRLPLTARTRETGDRIAAKGLGGTKKIKGIFIDEKIPISQRNTWPVVTDQAGEVVWLPGLKKSVLESKHAHDENSLLYLEYKKLKSSWGANNNNDDAE